LFAVTDGDGEVDAMNRLVELAEDSRGNSHNVCKGRNSYSRKSSRQYFRRVEKRAALEDTVVESGYVDNGGDFRGDIHNIGAGISNTLCSILPGREDAGSLNMVQNILVNGNDSAWSGDPDLAAMVTDISTSIIDNELDMYADIVEAPSFLKENKNNIPKRAWQRKIRKFQRNPSTLFI